MLMGKTSSTMMRVGSVARGLGATASNAASRRPTRVAAAQWTSGSVNGMHTSALRWRPITPPPPPPSSSSSSTSTPPSSSPSASGRGNVSARPTQVRSRPLPTVPNTLPYLASFIAAALASWAGFTLYATNKEKLSSSIFKSVVSQVKNSSEVSALLSSPTSSNSPGIVLKRETLLGGAPKVNGSVNMMQGRVDLSFKIHPSDDEGKTATVYFTSIRAHKHAPFEILRFVVVDDSSGESVSLLDRMGLSSIDVESGDIV